MRRTLAAAALTIVFLLTLAPSARAHPLGNFTVNRSAELVVAPGRVTILYAVDLAEIPAYQTLRELARDGAPTAAVLQAWADATAAEIVDGSVLRVDGRRVPLLVDDARASVAPGQAGLRTLRLDARLSAPIDPAVGRLTFVDRNDPGSLGWREIVARGVDGIALTGSDVPAVSVTDRLRTYPDDLLSSPLDVTSMRARFAPGPAAPAMTSVGPSPSTTSTVPGTLDRLLGGSGSIVMILGLVVAVALGAWHALLPGHGKSLTAAAVVGADARPRDAVVAGISVAGMHTLSVIGLGLVIVALERTFRPEAVYPWLRAASGVAAIVVGGHLVRRRWRSRRHEGRHRHDDHGEESLHHAGHDAHARALPRPGLAALALAGGILPSPSALLVLLASLQRGRAVYGLALVVAFSVGLAASLIAVGLVAMRAQRFVERRWWSRSGRLLPVASAFGIIVLGLVVVGRAVASL